MKKICSKIIMKVKCSVLKLSHHKNYNKNYQQNIHAPKFIRIYIITDNYEMASFLKHIFLTFGSFFNVNTNDNQSGAPTI